MKMITAIEKGCSRCVAYERDCGGCVRPGTIKPKYRRGKPPKDGTWIIGWWNKKPSVAQWLADADGDYFWVDPDNGYWVADPTKWIPLP